MSAYINRPWFQSFGFNRAPYSDKDLAQLHKLARNFAASLDLGCPSAKHVANPDSVDISKMSERERYLLWVKQWKKIYRELSQLIRMMKLFRKTVHYPKLTPSQKQNFENMNRGYNGNPADMIRGLSNAHLERLQETAQVLLNARWNGKLASAERRRRALAEQPEEKLAA